MNRVLIVLLAISAAVLGFGALHRRATQTRSVTDLQQQEWQASTGQVAAKQKLVSRLRGEVVDKRVQLRQATRHPEMTAELLALLEDKSSSSTSKVHAAGWAEFRQQLGIGWNTSPDYVLVNKRVLKGLQYDRLSGEYSEANDETRELLALSPNEESSLKSVLDHVREGQWLRIERTEPRGDIVAQYTVPLPDLAFEQSISNRFAAELVSLLGQERADMLFPHAWLELRGPLAPQKPETMTIRRTLVDGEPDLICEMRRGDEVSTSPVRYAHYPSHWFLSLFPGGWEALAQREGFELPQRFQPK